MEIHLVKRGGKRRRYKDVEVMTIDELLKIVERNVKNELGVLYKIAKLMDKHVMNRILIDIKLDLEEKFRKNEGKRKTK